MKKEKDLKNIFQKPHFVNGVGNIYPVKLGSLDEFMDCASILSYSYKHFNLDAISNDSKVKKNEIKLLDLVTLASYNTNSFEETIETLCELFRIVLRKEILYSSDQISGVYFYSVEENEEVPALINRDNYDEVRKIIMEQNIIFEPRVYKNDMVREWAEMALKARAKNAFDINLEDMITTIAVISGKHYWDLEDYSIYQLKAEFGRIHMDKNHTTTILFKAAGAENVEEVHYAENPKFDENPSDELFKSKSKLSKLDSAIK